MLSDSLLWWFLGVCKWFWKVSSITYGEMYRMSVLNATLKIRLMTFCLFHHVLKDPLLSPLLVQVFFWENSCFPGPFRGWHYSPVSGQEFQAKHHIHWSLSGENMCLPHSALVKKIIIKQKWIKILLLPSSIFQFLLRQAVVLSVYNTLSYCFIALISDSI